MLRYCYILLLLILLSCGRDAATPDDRPGTATDPQPEAPSAPTLTAAALADGTARIESEALTLRYGEPGVMVVKDVNTQNYTLRDLSTGRAAAFNPSSLQLSIDGGAPVATSYAARQQTRDDAAWYLLVDAATGANITIVIPMDL